MNLGKYKTAPSTKELMPVVAAQMAEWSLPIPEASAKFLTIQNTKIKRSGPFKNRI